MPSAFVPKPASYDLHMHTYWSYDATANPEKYFQKAQELGLRCIAITEHHTIDSTEENLKIAERYPEIRFIIAAELSVTTSVGAIDLLCYNLPRKPSGLFAKVLEEYHQWQRDAGAARSRIMEHAGFPYTDEARLELLKTYRPERVIELQGATHVANPREIAYFIEQGYVKSREELAELRKNSPISVPPYPAVERVTEAVKQAGGLIAIAHPPRYFLDADVKRMDLLREECALDGIECAHTRVDPELTKIYREYCKKHGLFSTGGSDTHHDAVIEKASKNWENSQEKRFAGHIGEDAWLDEFLERL